jgi:hypothetical protein
MKCLVFSGFYIKCPEKAANWPGCAKNASQHKTELQFWWPYQYAHSCHFWASQKVKKQKSPSFFQKWTF